MRRPPISVCLTVLALTYQAFAGKKVEFNATVRADISCELGYRITHVDKKNGSTAEYCAIGPKAAAPYLEKHVGKEVNIKGHDGTQVQSRTQILVLWINGVAGEKVKDYDPCRVSTVLTILAGVAGQMPPTPPGCGGDEPSSQPNADSAAETPGQVVYAGEQTNSGVANSQQTPAPVPSAHYVDGVPQCTRTQYEYQGGSLFVVNSCNIGITAVMTSDSGNFWGQIDVGPNNRNEATAFGIGYSPRRDGSVYLLTCPKGSQPMLPGGDFSIPHNYRGLYRCYQQ